MEKKEQLYEGKAKKVFATDDPNLVIVDYKDDATAFNGLKKGSIASFWMMDSIIGSQHIKSRWKIPLMMIFLQFR